MENLNVSNSRLDSHIPIGLIKFLQNNSDKALVKNPTT